MPKGKKEIVRYANHCLFGMIGAGKLPGVINIASSLTTFLESNGYTTAQAAELSERWLPQLRKHVSMRLDTWDELGVPRPFDFLESEENLATWLHPHFEEITGRKPLPNDFRRIYEWLLRCSEREFLAAAAIFLKIAGADFISITDGRGDGGVDLIGRITRGAIGPIYIFLQAKTSSQWLGREVLLVEHGKFLASSSDENRSRYRALLKKPNSRESGASCYILVTNSEFRDGVRSIANKLGVLTKSCMQLAFLFSKSTSFSAIEAICQTWKQFGPPTDPEENVASKIVL